MDDSNVGLAIYRLLFSINVKCGRPIRWSLRAAPYLSGMTGAMAIILNREQERAEKIGQGEQKID